MFFDECALFVDEKSIEQAAPFAFGSFAPPAKRIFILCTGNTHFLHVRIMSDMRIGKFAFDQNADGQSDKCNGYQNNRYNKNIKHELLIFQLFGSSGSDCLLIVKGHDISVFVAVLMNLT